MVPQACGGWVSSCLLKRSKTSLLQQQEWSKYSNMQNSSTVSFSIYLLCPSTPRDHPAAVNITTYLLERWRMMKSERLSLGSALLSNLHLDRTCGSCQCCSPHFNHVLHLRGRFYCELGCKLQQVWPCWSRACVQVFDDVFWKIMWGCALKKTKNPLGAALPSVYWEHLVIMELQLPPPTTHHAVWAAGVTEVICKDGKYES